jgi:hypothetical protein
LSIGDILNNAIVIDNPLGKAIHENPEFKHAFYPFLQKALTRNEDNDRNPVFGDAYKRTGP